MHERTQERTPPTIRGVGSAERKREFELFERAGWARQHATYDGGFGRLCAGAHEPLLDAARVGDRSRVLEVGCGSGRMARAAAGRGARVIATDPVHGMARTTSRAVPALVATLPALPFTDGQFDAALGAFVLNHVPDAEAAVAELHRVLRPGARLAVSVWAGDARNRALGVITDAVRESEVDTASGTARYSPLAGTTLAKLLRGAGFRDVDEHTHTWQHRTTTRDWWDAVRGGTVRTAALLARSDDAETHRIRLAFERACEPYRTPDGIALPAAAIVASGTR